VGARHTIRVVIDLHSHVLPGLDDGAATIEESLLILHSMAADGVSLVCGTPHVRADWPTTADAMERALAAVRAAAAEVAIAVEVRGGGEVAVDRLPGLDPAERARLGLGGNPGLLLVETPYFSWPRDMARLCARLVYEGVQPLVAHPERNADVIARPSLIDDVVAAGALVQITAASVDGRIGPRIEGCARELLARRLVHAIASDAHTPGVRDAGLSAAVRAVGDPGLGRWLVEDAPAALLAGEPLTSRPAYVPPRRRSLFRRRRP
jgi:protein-tyrosine phosphatase